MSGLTTELRHETKSNKPASTGLFRGLTKVEQAWKRTSDASRLLDRPISPDTESPASILLTNTSANRVLNLLNLEFSRKIADMSTSDTFLQLLIKHCVEDSVLDRQQKVISLELEAIPQEISLKERSALESSIKQPHRTASRFHN